MFPLSVAVPSRYLPLATWTLIAANCAVFLIQINLTPEERGWFLYRFALIPARYFPPGGSDSRSIADYLPFLSNMFLHGGWLHLILNMWALWLFGPIVEDRLGPARYLVFYVATGIVASLTHVVFNPASSVPALGASGAIAGVLGCFIRLFPFARTVVLIPIFLFPLFVEVPAIFFAALWFMLQVLQGTGSLLTPEQGDGVAWWAHVGGFAAGFLLTPVLRQTRPRYRRYFADEGILGFDPQGRP